MENAPPTEVQDPSPSDTLPSVVNVRLHEKSNADFPLYRFLYIPSLDLDTYPRLRLTVVHSARPTSRAETPDLPSGSHLTVYRLWYRDDRLLAEITKTSFVSHMPPLDIPSELRGLMKRLRRRGAQIDQEHWLTHAPLTGREPGSAMPGRKDCIRIPRHQVESFYSRRPAHDRRAELHERSLRDRTTVAA